MDCRIFGHTAGRQKYCHCGLEVHVSSAEGNPLLHVRLGCLFFAMAGLDLWFLQIIVDLDCPSITVRCFYLVEEAEHDQVVPWNLQLLPSSDCILVLLPQIRAIPDVYADAWESRSDSSRCQDLPRRPSQCRHFFSSGAPSAELVPIGMQHFSGRRIRGEDRSNGSTFRSTRFREKAGLMATFLLRLRHDRGEATLHQRNSVALEAPTRK